MRRKKIGTMDFHGSVDITDPCYNRDVWCRMTDVKIRNGVYTCIAWHHKDKGTFDNGEPYCYDVIGIIGIYLDGVIPCQKEMKEIGSIGVVPDWQASFITNRIIPTTNGPLSAIESGMAMPG